MGQDLQGLSGFWICDRGIEPKDRGRLYGRLVEIDSRIRIHPSGLVPGSGATVRWSGISINVVIHRVAAIHIGDIGGRSIRAGNGDHPARTHVTCVVVDILRREEIGHPWSVEISDWNRSCDRWVSRIVYGAVEDLISIDPKRQGVVSFICNSGARRAAIRGFGWVRPGPKKAKE